MTNLHLDRGLKILSGAEAAFKALLSQMAASGDYEAMPAIARMAGELRKIGISTNSNLGGLATHPIPGPTVLNGSPHSSYPDFSRNLAGDRLRMVGWSKKHGGVYKHEAPKLVLKVLVDALLESGGAEEPVSMEDLLPNIAHPETGREFPEYHSRTFLRWLRTINVVEKAGHKGYGFAPQIGEDPWPTIEAAWERLPVRD